MNELFDLPKTWKRRVQVAGLTIDKFCKNLGIQERTFRGKNPTLFTVSKIELAIQELEKKN